MSADIENIIFSRFVNQAIPFEFISIEELYERCRKSEYDLSNPHRIKFHALIVVTKGKGSHMIDFKEYLLTPGVILPLTREQVHAFDKKSGIGGYVISFEESFITQNVNEQNLFHFLQLYHTPSIVIAKENLVALNPFFDLLRRVNPEDNLNMKAELINSVFMALLFQIKRLSISENQTFESTRFTDFIRFKQLLRKNYRQSHNAKEYAFSLSISYKYLNDICKEVSNQTAKAFIDSWLLLEIKRNLSEKKFTTQEISFKVGFQEPSNFVRFFKRHEGITPKNYIAS